MNFKYKKVVVGGTFDLLHLGHKALINKAFETGKEVVIGITTDKFGKNSFENQALRLKNLKVFLKNKKFKIIWLGDIFGTTLSDLEIEAIVVSPETKFGALIINKERAKKGLKKLDIIVVSFVKDDFGKIISSTRIRQGEISPEGFNYKKFLLKIAGQKLSEKIRNELKKSFGKIVSISNIQKENTVTVGDITTQKFLEAGIVPKLAVIDYLVARQPFLSNIKPTTKVISLPGQISKALIIKIEKSLRSQNNQVIQVLGEEDLAAIPTILLAPLGSSVFYGQPNEGLILVKVSLEIKDRVYNLLS